LSAGLGSAAASAKSSAPANSQQFEKFAQEQIGPHTQAAGFPSPPELTFYDLHSYMSEG